MDGPFANRGRRWPNVTVAIIALWTCASPALSQQVSLPPPLASNHATDPPLAEAMQRIEQLEQTVFELQQRQNGGLIEAEAPICFDAPTAELPTHYPIYDSGWTLRPYDAAKTPFELTIGLHNQFRYTGFSRDEATTIDAAGNVNTIPNRNDFDVNRGRLVFSGYALDKDLGFYANIDYSTVASSSIQPLLGWISFRHNDALTLYMGLGKVPGTWEWQQTSRYTMGADRTLATTFFRPSITAGMWGIGKLGDSLSYTVFVGNGLNTLTLRSSDLDTNFVYSALAWWEPLGEFGVGFSDQEHHDNLAIRVGHGLTQTKNDSTSTDQSGAEQTVVRLSDGTRLVEPNALAPGVTVNAFDVWLYTAHLGLKKQGYSFSSEVFMRWLRNIEGTGGTSLESLLDNGFYIQGGAFVIPKKLELFVRGSAVTGDFGTGSEVAAGLNWHLFDKRSARFTLDVTDIRDSPAEQSRTGYVAGESGTLLRAQLWTFF
ncbi:secreted protein [Rhodopirellula maiorica SM1]|uniref:Secreted protein n=2 Tax=Novipirellula TaxID=2795426 RepID=M5RR74_9BACT|nr:secreted protein [Rhodopirellula maiorica SM1]